MIFCNQKFAGKILNIRKHREKRMKIKVIIEKGVDGYFVARCPSLKSCWSQGRTEEEALENIKEAIQLYLEPDEDLVENSNQKIFELAV